MTSYENDVIAWSIEQAGFIRAGRWDQLDLEHLADEIEDVGKAERHEFESRMALLLAHLLKWQFQPERRGKSWELTIKEQRRRIARRLEETPSLKADLKTDDFWDEAWEDGRRMAEGETGILNVMPAACPWVFAQLMNPDFWPD